MTNTVTCHACGRKFEAPDRKRGPLRSTCDDCKRKQGRRRVQAHRRRARGRGDQPDWFA